MPESDQHSLVGLFSLGARLSSKTGSTDTFKMAADQRKMVCTFFFQNFINNSLNCTIFGAQEDLGCPFNLSYFDQRHYILLLLILLYTLCFDLGVTSRDL